MFVYAGRKYTAARTGSAIKQVCCEKCQTHYGYEVVRRATGEGNSPYYLRNNAAKNEAMKMADRRLATKLARAIDPVPCPDCGWFQKSMVMELRRRAHRWMLWTGYVIGSLFLASAVMGLLAATKTFSAPLEQHQAIPVFALAGIGLLVGGLFLAARHALTALIDPNRGGAGGPVPLPGAPRGVKLGVQTQQHPHAPAVQQAQPSIARASAITTGLQYETRPSALEPGGWVTIQLAKVRYPARCCACLNETRKLQTYQCGRLAQTLLPLCEQCASQCKRNHWLTQIVAALLGVALALVLGIAAPTPDVAFYIGISIGGLLVGALVGVPVANRLSRPAMFSRFRAELNTVRVRFRNPNYLRPFLEWGQLV
jgi:hypothetical protein